DYLHFGRLQVKPEPGIEIKQPWFGIEIEVLKEGKFEGRPIITKIFKGSPSEKAGLKEGDIIIVFNGVGVWGEKRWLERLPQLIESAAQGSCTTTLIKREGKRECIKIPKVFIEMKEKKDIPPGSF
ncbi:MAG: hypothetical protein COZ07_05565, partial [Candidatus Infernicultor aquiphilus]